MIQELLWTLEKSEVFPVFKSNTRCRVLRDIAPGIIGNDSFVTT
jgi:hypothetical protein